MNQKIVVAGGIVGVLLSVLAGGFSIVPWQVASVLVAVSIGVPTLLSKLEERTATKGTPSPPRKKDGKKVTNASIKKIKLKTKHQLIIIAISAIIVLLIVSMFFLSNNHLFNSPNTSQDLDFAPKGTAYIELKNGDNFLIPANSLVYVEYSSLIQGLPDGNSVVLFEDIASFKFENNSIIATLLDGKTKNLTGPAYGSWDVANFAFAFMAPTTNGKLDWQNIKQVTFNHSGVWQQQIQMATITTASNQSFSAPSEMIFYQEVSAGFGPATVWNLGFNLKSGNFLAFNNIKRVEFNASSTVDNVLIHVTTTDGETFDTAIKGDSYFWSYICGLNKFGVFKLVLHNELKSIDFNWSS